MFVKDNNKIKLKIAASALTSEQKQDLTLVVEGLPFNLSRFLNLKISGSDAENTYLIIRDSANAIQALESGAVEDVVKFFAECLSYDDVEYTIPFALDVHDFLNKHNLPGSEQVWQALDKFEAAVFRFLPQAELQDIIKNNLLYFVANLPNAVMEFKRAYWLEELSDDGTWGQGLRAALEANAEQLGKSGLVRDEKNYPPTVANWLKDYVAYINKPLTERVAFDQVQYIERAPNVQRLNVYERKDLLEIIKLHAWLMDPEVTEAEINSYEGDLGRQTAKMPAAPVTPPKAAPIPPPDDWVQTAQQRRAEEERKIDAKLRELTSAKNKTK